MPFPLLFTMKNIFDPGCWSLSLTFYTTGWINSHVFVCLFSYLNNTVGLAICLVYLNTSAHLVLLIFYQWASSCFSFLFFCRCLHTFVIRPSVFDLSLLAFIFLPWMNISGFAFFLALWLLVLLPGEASVGPRRMELQPCHKVHPLLLLQECGPVHNRGKSLTATPRLFHTPTRLH